MGACEIEPRPQLWFQPALLIRLEDIKSAQGRPFWRCQIEAEMLVSCLKHLAANVSQLHKLNHVATLGTTMPRQMSSIQGKPTCLMLPVRICYCLITAAQLLPCL